MSSTTIILYQISPVVDEACLNILFDGHVKQSLFSGYGTGRIAIVDLDDREYTSNVIAESKAGGILRGRLNVTEMKELLNGKLARPKKKNSKRKRQTDEVEIPQNDNNEADEKVKLILADSAEEVDRALVGPTSALGSFSFLIANEVPFGIAEFPISVAGLQALGGNLTGSPHSDAANKLPPRRNFTYDKTHSDKHISENGFISTPGSRPTEKVSKELEDKHALFNSSLNRMQAKPVPAFNPPSHHSSEGGNAKRTVLNHVSFDDDSDDDKSHNKKATSIQTGGSKCGIRGDEAASSAATTLNNRQRKEQRRNASGGAKGTKVIFNNAD